MKNIFTTILLLLGLTAFSQTNMTVHTNTGSTSYLLSAIDSITYDNGGGSSTSSDTIGGSGQAGLIFYDKGSYSDGWRFLEVTPADLNVSPWGCTSTDITGTLAIIGSGQANTNLILASCSTPGISARVCDNYSVTVNSVVYDDWFLPSIDELNQLYYSNQSFPSVFQISNNLLSSTQKTVDYAWIISMGVGNYNEEHKSNSTYIRGIRKF